MQVVHFANSLVDARNELQHKYVKIYYRALYVFFCFLFPSSPAHASVLMETYLALELSVLKIC